MQVASSARQNLLRNLTPGRLRRGAARKWLSWMLLVEPHAAKDVAHPRDEADLLYGLCFAGPREHIADLGYRAFSLLPGVVDFLTEGLAGLVLERPCIRANEGLCLSRKDLAVADVSAEGVEVAIQEPAFTLDEHVDCFGLVRFDGGDRLREHGLSFLSGAEFRLRKRCTGEGAGD